MEATVASKEQPKTQAFTVSGLYSWYVLALLWLVAVFRFVDLQVFGVLMQSIKTEYSFTDTQLGVLTGISFSVFYSLLGLPIAWLADRYSRVNIIAIALGLWSLMTALCGTAGGFMSLFLTRMGVGVGEAGGYPPTASLVADYFPPKRRGLAFSILGSAIPVGVFVGFLVGGVVTQYYGWRAAFSAVGIPGVALAILIKLTMKEPPRGFSEGFSGESIDTTPAPPFLDTVKFLWAKRSYRFVVAGACLLTLGNAGSGPWLPSFFIRVHGMTGAEVGTWMAIMYGGGGLIGTMLGGTISGYMTNKHKDFRWYMRVCALSLIAAPPLAAFVYTASTAAPALAAQFVVAVLIHMNVGPVLAMVQDLSGSKRRATGMAINVLVTNIIALSLGPLLVGMFSDSFKDIYGDRALGYGILALVTIGYTLASLSFFLAGKTINADLQKH